MILRNALVVAVSACALLLTVTVAVLPVTIRAGDIVPESLAPLVPESLVDTEIECGSVLTPRSSDGGPSIPIVGDRATNACRQQLYRQAAIAGIAAVIGVAGAFVVGRRRSTSTSRPLRPSITQP